MEKQKLSPSGKCAFTWKKNHKITSSTIFGLESGESKDHKIPERNVKQRKYSLSAAQKNIQSNTLKTEGSSLASKGKLLEAIERWDEAVTFTPDDETIYEMKAQVLMILEKDFRAVKCAELAVAKNKLWWVSWMTLGRAQMNLKDFGMAARSFSKALHLHPYDNKDCLDELLSAVEWKKNQTEFPTS